MQLNEIVEQCHEDSKEWFPNKVKDLGYFTVCLAGEVGEFANLIKKAMRGTHDLSDDEFFIDVAFELTDVLIYVAIIAGALNLDLEELYTIKREVNSERFGKTSTNGKVQ